MTNTAKSDKTGIVYVFTNPAMPGYVKIGKTSRNNVEQRLKELSNPAGVPVAFQCPYAAEVEDETKVEEAIHKAFAVDRPNKKREFFTTDPQRIIDLLTAFAISDATPETQKMLDKITTPEDKEAAKTTPYRKGVDRLKKKGWDSIVEAIGSKNPKLQRLKMQLKAIPCTKGNADQLRAIIKEAKDFHAYRRAALLELLDELG